MEFVVCTMKKIEDPVPIQPMFGGLCRFGAHSGTPWCSRPRAAATPIPPHSGRLALRSARLDPIHLNNVDRRPTRDCGRSNLTSRAPFANRWAVAICTASGRSKAAPT